MERSIVPVTDQSHRGQRRDPTDASSAKNCSLSIDLGIPMPIKEAGDCEHFVMRQYVSDKREQDMNSCLPFDTEQPLPPMVVPKYKYWRCKNCLYGNGEVSLLEEIVAVSECSNCAPMSGTTSSPTPSDNEIEMAAILLSLANDKNANCTEDEQMIEIDGGNSLSESDKQYDCCEDGECPRKERLLEDLLKETANSEKSYCWTEGSPSSSIHQ